MLVIERALEYEPTAQGEAGDFTSLPFTFKMMKLIVVQAAAEFAVKAW